MTVLLSDLTLPRQQFERFINFLASDPGNISLRIKTIELGIECQLWQETEQLIEEGLVSQPDSVLLHGHAGTICLRNQKYQLASEHFEFVVTHSDATPVAISYNFAFALFYMGQYDKAFSILDGLHPDEGVQRSVYLLTARCLHHLGDLERAVNFVKRIDESQFDEEAQGLLALLLYETQKSAEALEAANRTLNSNPYQLDALLARASLETEFEHYNDARRDYIVATTAHPTCGRAWSGLAQLDMHDMQFDKAQAELEVALKYMPNHIGTWHMLAWIHILHGRASEAKAAFDKSYEIDRNFGETHGGFAVVAAMQQQRKLAEQHMRRARKLNPDGFSVYYAELLLLQSEGKTKEAQAFYDSVMENVRLPSGAIMGDLVKKRMAELSNQSAVLVH